MNANYIREEINRLSATDTFSDYSWLLSQLSKYYQKSIPSDMNPGIIQETEYLLNTLWQKSQDFNWDNVITEGLLEALTLSSVMSSFVKGTFYVSAQDLFRSSKELSNSLGYLSNF